MATSRGFLIETYSEPAWAEHGVEGPFVQENHSRSTAKGTLRGLHFQTAPGQAKLVRCLRGAIFDVAVDLRRESPTFGRWAGHVLDDETHHQFWVPVGFAHGFQVLSDVADVAYKLTSVYDPATEAGIAWDDPEVGGRVADPRSAAQRARPGRTAPGRGRRVSALLARSAAALADSREGLVRRGRMIGGLASQRKPTQKASKADPLAAFSEPTRDWFQRSFEGADAGPGRGLAEDRRRRQHADLRSDRVGQDARRLPLGDRPPRAAQQPGPGEEGAEPRVRGQDRLRLAAQGALLRRRAQPAGAAGRDRRRGRGRAAHRRHAAEGPPGDVAHAARHPDHDARVALSDDDLAGAQDPRRGRGRDRRRDPRRRAEQARRPHGADPRASRPPRPEPRARRAARALRRGPRRVAAPADPAHRPLGNAEAARADRQVPRRPGPRVRDRRRRHPQGDGPRDRRPGRGHGRPGLERAGPDRSPDGAGPAGRPVAPTGSTRSSPASPTTARSGRRSTRSCSSWSASTPRRSSSSTTAAAPSASPSASTRWSPRSMPRPIPRAARRLPRSHGPTMARSPTRSGPRSRSCSSREACPAWSRPPRSSSASTWVPSTW